jgi:hypothetical protein
VGQEVDRRHRLLRPRQLPPPDVGDSTYIAGASPSCVSKSATTPSSEQARLGRRTPASGPVVMAEAERTVDGRMERVWALLRD